jgi:hypothetical protein
MILSLLVASMVAAITPYRASADTTHSVRIADSAGIVVVDAGIAALPFLHWRIGAPLRLNGNPDPFFRLVGLNRSGRSTVAVGDGGASAIRTFDVLGHEGRPRGRGGEGPGEFRLLTAIGTLSGDSLWGFDMSLRRVSFFSVDGRPAGETSIAAGRSGSVGELLNVDRTEIVALTVPTTTAATASGLRRDSMEIFLLGRDGTARHRIAIVPGIEQQVDVQRLPGGLRVVKSSVPFGYRPVYTWSADGAVVGGTEAYSLRIYRPDGGLARLIRVAVSPRPTRGALLAEYAREAAWGIGRASEAGAIETAAGHGALHQFAPEIEAVVNDVGGGFWVRRFTAPSADSSEWVVHQSNGVPVGRIRLPSRWKLREVGRDYLLAIEHGEDDEEIVVYLAFSRR